MTDDIRPPSVATPPLDHRSFVAAWRSGAIEVAVDPRRAAGLLSSRMLLPFASIAVIGFGIGLVLWSWVWTGLAVGACGILFPRMIKRTAAGYVLQNVADDADLYRDALACGALAYRRTDLPDAGSETTS